MVYTGPTGTETTYYATPMFEAVYTSSGTDFRHYIFAADGRAVMQLSRSASGALQRSLLTDYQGGISSMVSDATGANFVSESYTPFGNRREASTWTGSPTTAELASMDHITRQGYTFQTVLGTMGLNHMNGRIEDSITGRFLSPDPRGVIRGNTQSWNRYSYVNNNPMSYTDPTGFCTYSSFRIRAGEAVSCGGVDVAVIPLGSVEGLSGISVDAFGNLDAGNNSSFTFAGTQGPAQMAPDNQLELEGPPDPSPVEAQSQNPGTAQSSTPESASLEAFNQALEANTGAAPYADLATVLLQETPVGPLVSILNDLVQSTATATDAVNLADGSSDGSVGQINKVVGLGAAGVTLVVGEAAAPPAALVTAFVATVTRGSQWILNQIVPQYYESMPVNLPGAPQYSIGSGLYYEPIYPQ